MTNSDPRSRPFRVLIAGGGIAGLTLLNALQQANIDAILFEARDSPIPTTGASVGVAAHGMRILDQLGIWERFRNVTVPTTFYEAWKEGKLFEEDDRPSRSIKQYVLVDRFACSI